MDADIRGELVIERFEISRRFVKENSRRKRFIDGEGEGSQGFESTLLLSVTGGLTRKTKLCSLGCSVKFRVLTAKGSGAGRTNNSADPVSQLQAVEHCPSVKCGQCRGNNVIICIVQEGMARGQRRFRTNPSKWAWRVPFRDLAFLKYIEFFPLLLYGT